MAQRRATVAAPETRFRRTPTRRPSPRTVRRRASRRGCRRRPREPPASSATLPIRASISRRLRRRIPHCLGGIAEHARQVDAPARRIAWLIGSGGGAAPLTRRGPRDAISVISTEGWRRQGRRRPSRAPEGSTRSTRDSRVHRVERRRIRKVHARADDVGERQTAACQDRRVVENDAGLRGHVAGHDRVVAAAAGHDAGQKERVAGPDRIAVRVGRPLPILGMNSGRSAPVGTAIIDISTSASGRTSSAITVVRVGGSVGQYAIDVVHRGEVGGGLQVDRDGDDLPERGTGRGQRVPSALQDSRVCAATSPVPTIAPTRRRPACRTDR